MFSQDSFRFLEDIMKHNKQDHYYFSWRAELISYAVGVIYT